jgi:hypothetical protein
MEVAEEHPIPMGLGLAALGMLAGLLLPRTRREDELMGAEADAMKHRAVEFAGDVADEAQSAAQDTAIAARAEAERQGLTKDELAEKSARVVNEANRAARDTENEEGLAPRQMADKVRRVAEATKDAAAEQIEERTESTKEKTEAHAKEGKQDVKQAASEKSHRP